MAIFKVEILKKYMETKNINKKEFSKISGISEHMVNKLLSGKDWNHRLNLVFKLRCLFDRPLEQMFNVKKIFLIFSDSPNER